MNDFVNNPKHYKEYGFETIDLIEVLIEKMKHKELILYVFNAIKYIIRANFKGHKIQDLQKALWYIKRSEKYCIKEKTNTILDDSEIVGYLSKVAKKDFKTFIILELICNFAINPTIFNKSACVIGINRQLKELI